MAVMQRQESFNRFYQEFVVDEAPRCTEGGPYESGVCVYRNEETGKGCAIGIQPEFVEIYKREFEEAGINALYKLFPEIREIIAAQDIPFFVDMQNLHDNVLEQVEIEEFKRQLVGFAREWKVKIPE